MFIVNHQVLLVAGLALVGAAGPAMAADPSEPSQLGEGISLPRPTGIPDRLYGGDVFTTGGARAHIVIVEGDDASRPARWMRVDDAGAVLWEADHRCPNFADFTTLLEPQGTGASAARAVCKVGRTVIGVDVDTGREAWSFTDPRPLYMTVRAGDRVATSVDNEQVVVLDAATGKELLRFDVDGAVLEAATLTPKGPIALLVQDSADAESASIELPVGEGGALEKVPYSGDDPGRRLVAIAIGGPARRGIHKPRVVWSVPFGGYSFDIDATAAALIGEPARERVTAYDPATGKALWERPEPDGEVRAWGNEGGAFARPLAGGGVIYGALDGVRGKVIWDAQVADALPPLAVGAGDGDLGVVWQGGFLIAAFGNGKTKFERRLSPGEQLIALRTTATSVLWVTTSGGTRTLQVARL
ncbi:MAG: PQQ-binding-like beta-propeller repeat protein [Deltaproteobacteria bacterium]|nr:PQQ-binding-like beta-propeller repeat protein [Deltaproteobacteria bacterium]